VRKNAIENKLFNLANNTVSNSANKVTYFGLKNLGLIPVRNNSYFFIITSATS
jgi:hypothetical protein